MRPKHTLQVFFLSAFAILSLFAMRVSAQTSIAQPQITQVVDDTKLTVLHGNTHPMARAEFDRGAAPADLPAERMQLVLKRSPAQQAALDKLIAEQQDKSSPNYHRWLTPAEFGRQFGAADQDVQTITAWLGSRGFQVSKPSDGRSVIEFSGNVAQVQETFHTSIHKFVVNGEDHWANTSDPSIPTALTPVVAGVNTLHNFFPKPSSRAKAAPTRSQNAATNSVRPGVTFTGNFDCGLTVVTDCFGIGPADFGTIYNVTPLWNAGIDGTGQTIAIVADSNIVIQDNTDFRNLFSLPAKDPVVTVNGTNPGTNSDEVEAILDVEWAGAVARNANINLVVSAGTNTQFGGDLSDTFIVNENPTPSILSESFGACELSLGSVENAFLNSTWSQAATEGITVIVSTGDNGSAACDIPAPAVGSCGFSANATVQVASCGLQVNGLASTPFNIAVGGTEFNDIANPLNFWSINNTATTLGSALSYIPERTYNDTCTDPAVWLTFFGLASAEAACNNSVVQNQPNTPNSVNDFFASVSAGSGGASNCTTFDGTDPLSCTGGYPKPSWQVALTPLDTKRDLPDVSMFSGDGTISGSFYIVCNRDFSGITGSCNLSNGNFLNVGGTSVSAQAFAGIMALVDQKNESKEGNANTVLYPLALASAGDCNSAGPPATGCVFNDITVGTIAMPCSAGTENCVVNTPGDLIGVLSGFSAGAGYDLATGLGSVNAANLVNAPTVWNTGTGTHSVDFTLSANSATVPVANPGAQGTVGVTVAADGGFTGVVTFTCLDLPSLVTCAGSSVTGSGTSTITFTTTAASRMPPISGPNHIGLPTMRVTAALTCAFGLLLLLLAFWDRKRRLSMAFAMTTLALLVVIAGCGGGSGGGGGGGGGGGNPGTAVGTTTVVITGTSGTIERSVAVSLVVN
jgi:subtilase family serine protease